MPKKKKKKLQQSILLCTADCSSSKKELRHPSIWCAEINFWVTTGRMEECEERPESLQQQEQNIIVNNTWIQWAEYLKLHISSDCFVLFQVILKVKYELHFSCSLTCFLPICMNLRKPVKVMFIFYYHAISHICLTHICEDTPEGREVKVKFNVRRRWEWSQVYDDVFKVTFEGDADITGMW